MVLGFVTLMSFLNSMKKQWEWVYWLCIDQIKKDEETLHAITSKEGSAVNNKFWTMFICNFRESLQYPIQTQNDSGQPLCAPKKYPQKNDQERIFSINF